MKLRSKELSPVLSTLPWYSGNSNTIPHSNTFYETVKGFSGLCTSKSQSSIVFNINSRLETKTTQTLSTPVTVSKWKHMMFWCFLVAYTEETRLDHRQLQNMCSSKEIVKRDFNLEAFRFNILLLPQERFKLPPLYLRKGLWRSFLQNTKAVLINSPELSLQSQGGLHKLIGGQFCGYILAQTSF